MFTQQTMTLNIAEFVKNFQKNPKLKLLKHIGAASHHGNQINQNITRFSDSAKRYKHTNKINVTKDLKK